MVLSLLGGFCTFIMRLARIQCNGVQDGAFYTFNHHVSLMSVTKALCCAVVVLCCAAVLLLVP